MSDIELEDLDSYSQKELIESSKQDKKIKKKFRFKSLLFSIIVFLIVLFLLFSIYFQISPSNVINQKNQKPSLEKVSKPKKLQTKKIIPYITPNKLEGTLDYILYPYHSDIIRNMDD